MSIAAIALCAIAVWGAASRYDNLAGVLLGAASCLKPQIGICFLLYYALRRNWRVTLSGVAVAGGIGVAGLLWLSLRFGMGWVHYFLSNANDFAASNKFNDFTYSQPMRFTLINLQVLFYSISGNAAFANWLALGLGAVMLAVWAWSVWRNDSRPVLLALSAICVVSLLPVYHRSYDATLLIFPICWSLGRMQRAGWRERGTPVTLLMILPFALPGAALLQALLDRKYIPAGWAGSWWWNAIAMPHEIWLLLALACWLLYPLAINKPSELGQASAPGQASSQAA